MTARPVHGEGQGHLLPMPHRFLRSLAVCWSSRSSLLLCPIRYRCSPAAAGCCYGLALRFPPAPPPLRRISAREGCRGGGWHCSCFGGLYRSRDVDANAARAETKRIAFSGGARSAQAVRIAGLDVGRALESVARASRDLAALPGRIQGRTEGCRTVAIGRRALCVVLSVWAAGTVFRRRMIGPAGAVEEAVGQRPQTASGMIVERIADPAVGIDLTLRPGLDENRCHPGVKSATDQTESMNIRWKPFHGEWNDILSSGRSRKP